MNVTINQLSPEEDLAPRAHPANFRTAIIGREVDDIDVEDAGSLEDISGEDGEVYHPFILERTKSRVRVYIRELDILSLADVETGRLLVQESVVVRAPGREAKVGMALELAATVFRRRKDAETGEYVYEPFFADANAAQAWLKKRGNMDIYNDLAGAIYQANPLLDPKKKLAVYLKSQMPASG